MAQAPAPLANSLQDGPFETYIRWRAGAGLRNNGDRVRTGDGGSGALSRDQIGSLDLNLVLVFDALLRHENVTRAAGALQVTQSAVSHSLTRLRRYFDDQLFTRTASGVTPTALALELSGTVTQIASLVRNGLQSQAAFTPETSSRTLTLSLTDLGECSILPALMEGLKEAAPNCSLRTIQTQPHETRAMLESGEIDLAIGSILVLPEAQGQIYGRRLNTQSNIVLAHADSFQGDVIDIDRYCDTPQISVAPVRGSLSVIDAALSRMGRRRPIVLTTEHHLVIPHLIRRAPHLIATVPRTVLDLFHDERSFRALELPIELPKFDVFQYWHARSHRDRFHTWFRNLVSESFQHSRGRAPVMSDAHNGDEVRRDGRGPGTAL